VSADRVFRDLRPGETFRFLHHPDEGPYLKTGEREYLSLAVRRVGVSSAPVAHVLDVPALEHLARLAAAAPAPPTDFAALMGPPPAVNVDAIANELAEDLLTCGHNPGATKGDHLRIMLEGRELAGWNETALRARVRVAIRKAAAAAPAPAVLEAIQDEEALLRIALAFRAIAADHSTLGGPVYDLAWRLAAYLEKPAEAHEAIKAQQDRERRTRRTR
jgi:hypothetical protein